MLITTLQYPTLVTDRRDNAGGSGQLRERTNPQAGGAPSAFLARQARTLVRPCRGSIQPRLRHQREDKVQLHDIPAGVQACGRSRGHHHITGGRTLLHPQD